VCVSCAYTLTAEIYRYVLLNIRRLSSMVWYGTVNVDLYSAIITKVSNALDTLVSGEKPGFQTLSEGQGLKLIRRKMRMLMAMIYMK